MWQVWRGGHDSSLGGLMLDPGWASLVAQTLKALPAMQETRFDPWVGKTPWRREWQPVPVFLLENPMDGGAWWARVHEVAKSRTRLSNLTYLRQHAFLSQFGFLDADLKV